MKITKFNPMAAPNIPNTEPFLRVFENEGCGSEGCNCSDGWLISVSDGQIGLLITFEDEKEFKSYF